VKLVWHADNLVEVDWLRHVFGNLIEDECTDLELTCFDDDSIHVVSSNWQPLPTYEEYFRECRARCRRLVLFHASDEWFSGGYGLYQHFDAVIRNFATGLARQEGIWTIPEGYANGTRTGTTIWLVLYGGNQGLPDRHGLGACGIGTEFPDRHHIHLQGRRQEAEQGRIR
jgi:hypothetical protein